MPNVIHPMSIPTTMNKSTSYLGPQPHLNSHRDLEHQFLDSSSPSGVDLHNPPTLTKATTSLPILAATSTDSSSSLSPTLSSSVSSLNSSSSSSTSYFSTYPSNDSSLLSGDHFYNHLQTHTSLLRVVLQKSHPGKLMLGQWQRLDLKVLDEFGIAMEGRQAKSSIMGVSCELLEHEKGSTTYTSNHWQVVWRPLHYDAWHWTEETRHMTTCCGFDRSGVGGLEYKVIRRSDDTSARVKKTRPTELYMRIVPTFDPYQTIHALPLVVGPFTVLSNDTNAWQIDESHNNNSCSNNNNNSPDATCQQLQHQLGSHSHKPWRPASTTKYSQEMYRAFKLGNLDRYFLIKEGWNMGTPGKMWDSALVISDLFVQKIIQQPACFGNLHILDLSAGTGTAGLLIHYIYKYMFPDYWHPSITLTDLPEALPLIYYNKKMNGINASEKELSVVPLSWGQSDHIRLIQTKAPIDIIIVSDVLYEPTKFGVLVSTLVDLSEPGRTVIYLGYKRRGLKDTEEQQFFDLCYDHFDMQVLGYDSDDDEGYNNGAQDELDDNSETNDDQERQYHHPNKHSHTNKGETRNDKVGWETQYGKLVKNGTRMDGEGWLGPFAGNWRANIRHGKDVTRQSFQQTGVQVFRLVRKQH